VTSAAPATLTVDQRSDALYMGDIAGAVSLVKAGSGTLTFTNAVPMTTTGTVAIISGTLAVGDVTGGFGATPLIRINGGTLNLRNGNALPDTAAVRVAGDGRIDIKAGVVETVGTLVLDGEARAAGTWGATGSGATHVDDAFFSGTGQLNVLNGSPGSYADAVWDGGGEDAYLSTAANWDGDALPSFEGYGRAVFASGGTSATVDAPASFVRMTFNAAADFTVAAGAGVLTNGGGGLRAGAPTAASRTYTLAEDLVFGDHQAWRVDNNGAGVTTVNVTGSLSDGGAGYSLTKSGSGVLVLSGDNTYGGSTTVKTNGYLVLRHGNALGSAAGATSIENGG
jgi:autotransporter-associated beta strand protein